MPKTKSQTGHSKHQNWLNLKNDFKHTLSFWFTLTREKNYIYINVYMNKFRTLQWDQPQISEWLAANFSKQYHCWMKHKRHENQGNDHKLVKLVICNKFSLLISQVMYKERYGEYTFWCWGLKVYFTNWLLCLLWFWFYTLLRKAF